eukprot:CAMPEP_0183729856 /NCGR_PEP_ID=MMETSP0737-20130205/31404_1 /TAXON_ID=385413 /ORGANISM="Thalassiosira miniscula, Strain CCMP1093" /LENGTH=83 /DNA_ID=CAMNT_0025962167 /DNA_START=345 /DNA_END=596 /DNA_ORIENTATION=-
MFCSDLYHFNWDKCVAKHCNEMQHTDEIEATKIQLYSHTWASCDEISGHSPEDSKFCSSPPLNLSALRKGGIFNVIAGSPCWK